MKLVASVPESEPCPGTVAQYQFVGTNRQLHRAVGLEVLTETAQRRPIIHLLVQWIRVAISRQGQGLAQAVGRLNADSLNRPCRECDLSRIVGGMSVVGSVNGAGVLWIGDEVILREAARCNDRAVWSGERLGLSVRKPVATIPEYSLGSCKSRARDRINARRIRLQSGCTDTGSTIQPVQQA